MVAKTKKQLLVEKHPQLMYYIIKWSGGGELPKKLTGYFQTPAEANRAVAAHNQEKR